MKSLIVGNGQIGSALFEIFSKFHETHVRDFEAVTLEDVEVLHIAYPWSDKFVEITRAYIDEYKPKLTMIHSTVKIGTTRKLGEHVVYTPERGRFPNLAKEMIVYKKFIGGDDMDDLVLASRYFLACKWPVQIVSDPDTTETLKLVSNAHMGLEIAWRQELDRWEIDAKAYAMWEDSYFHGYIYTGQMEIVRPRMDPGPIGGHCILPSVDIMAETFKSSLILEFIKYSNEQAQRKKDSFAVAGNGHAEVSLIR